MKPVTKEKASPQGSKQQLPPYILTIKGKLDQTVDSAAKNEESNMNSAVNQLKGHVAFLRENCNIVESSVLQLGVDTTHRIISTTTEAQKAMEGMEDYWKAVRYANREVQKQWEELFTTVSGAYFSLKQRNESLEKELQHFVKERDSRDAALDRVAEYLHEVVAERTHWQKQQSAANPADLVLEDQNFINKTSAALDALYAFRSKKVNQGSAGSSLITSNPNNTSHSKEEKPEGAAKKTIIPSGKMFTSSVDSTDVVADRWRANESARHAIVTPSTRLHYVPPEEEVKLLRDTLAMGTGNSMLMLDIQQERDRLAEKQKEVSQQCLDCKNSIKKMRKELANLKFYIRETMEQRAPFISYKNEILKLLQVRVAEEVRAVLRAKTDRDPNIREMEGAYIRTADPRNLANNGSSISQLSSVPAEAGGDRVHSISNPLYHNAHNNIHNMNPATFQPPELGADTSCTYVEPPLSEEELEWRRLQEQEQLKRDSDADFFNSDRSLSADNNQNFHNFNVDSNMNVFSEGNIAALAGNYVFPRNSMGGRDFSIAAPEDEE